MIELTRKPNWATLLSQYVASRTRVPFTWGSNDCCSFAIFAIEELTGTLVFPITWDSEETALRAIARAGGIEQACTNLFGAPSDKHRLIRRGDVALVAHDNMSTIMICTGSQVCGPGIDGVAFYPIKAVSLHWKIG